VPVSCAPPTAGAVHPPGLDRGLAPVLLPYVAEEVGAGAACEELAESYLALGRVDDAVRVVTDATRGGYSEGAEMLCELGEKLMRSGHEPQAKGLWSEALATFPDDVWIYVQAGIEYSDLGDHATALAWLTPGVELALRTGDPESALEQLVPLRAASLVASGDAPDDLQARAQRVHTRTKEDARG
jgi:tetratricopeptide (TPR) repeat protein